MSTVVCQSDAASDCSAEASVQEGGLTRAEGAAARFSVVVSELPRETDRGAADR